MAHPRNPKNWCKCGKHIRNSRSGLCRKCWCEENGILTEKRTLGSATQTASRHRHQKVRNHAKRLMESWERTRCCHVCGYDKHVEIAHIRPISDFPLTATFGEINDPYNLLYLCPNHHWELDNGLLPLR